MGERPSVAWLTAAVVYAAAWVAAVGVLLARRWPRRPPPAPASDISLHDEPPAVVNLLVNGTITTGAALAATAVDLAARGFCAFERLGPGQFVARVRPEPADQAAELSLSAYDRQVLELLRSRAVGGVVPTEALTAGPTGAARRWRRRFRRAVAAEARNRGLTRDLFSLGELALVVGSAVATYVFIALSGTTADDLDPASGATASPHVAAAWLAFAVVSAGSIALASSLTDRQRPTGAGRLAASRWLGTREQLADGGFDAHGPDGTAVWGRHLAHAAALGVATTVLRALPMGAEHDRHAWSHAGGRWRPVTVSYPWWRPGWGRSWPVALAHGAVGAFVTGAVVRLLATSQPVAVPDAELNPYVDLLNTLARVVTAGFALAMAWFLVEASCALADIGRRRRRVGVIVRQRTRTAHPLLNSARQPRPRYFVALDDGTRDRIVAYTVSAGVHHACPQGATVALRVSPVLGHVSAMEPASVLRHSV